MFLLHFVDNCSVNVTSKNLNDVFARPNITDESNIFENAATGFITVVAIIGVITNMLTVINLSQPRFKNKTQNMRCSSLYHAIIELLLNLWITSDEVAIIIQLPDDKYVAAMLYSTLTFWSINALLCSRNWMVTLVALARLEAIFRPLQIRSSSIFSPCKTRLYTSLILLSSFSLSLVRVFYKKAIICTDMSLIRFDAHWKDNEVYHYFEIFAFFIYQSLFPVLIVTVSTVTMIFFLFKQQFKSTSKSFSRCHNHSSHHVISSQQRATLTITIIAGVFTITEFPIFIITLLQFMKMYANENRLLQYLYQVSRGLVVIDSCCNFIIYVSTSEQYRRNLRFLLSKSFRCNRRGFLYGPENFAMSRVVSVIPHHN